MTREAANKSAEMSLAWMRDAVISVRISRQVGIYPALDTDKADLAEGERQRAYCGRLAASPLRIPDYAS